MTLGNVEKKKGYLSINRKILVALLPRIFPRIEESISERERFANSLCLRDRNENKKLHMYVIYDCKCLKISFNHSENEVFNSIEIVNT